MKLSLFQKLSLLSIPTILVGVVVGWVAWNSLHLGTDRLEAAHELSELALKSQYYVSEMSDALRGSLLDPSNPREAQRKKEADEGNESALEAMKKLTADPSILAAIEKVSDFDEHQLNPTEDRVLEKVAQEGAPAARLLYQKEYLPLRNEYNSLLSDLNDLVQKTSQAAALRVHQQTEQALILILASLAIGTVLSLIALAGMSLWLRREMCNTLARLHQVEREISLGAETLASAGTEVSHGSRSATASLEQTVAAIEELTSMVKVTAESARAAADRSNESRQDASVGEQEVQSLNSSIGDIVQSSRKIEEIIHVIEDIAFQTNLLALNAAVEAARAGEQGKGFAVVADAVRQLAHRSAAAAKDISHLIRESVQFAEKGSITSQRSGDVLRGILSSIQKISALNQEIAIACTEQSNGIAQISRSMHELDQSTATHARAAITVSSASEGLAAQALGLTREIENLQTMIHGEAASATFQAPALRLAKSR